MTEVQFHVKVGDRLGYTCRLLRKALRKGTKVAVTGAPGLLAELDRALWTFDAGEFLPHLRLAAGAAPSAQHRHTPLWLVDDARGAEHLPVLVNLANLDHEPPRGFESFERLFEVVSDDAAELAAGRRRWKHYAGRGYAVAMHEAVG